MLASWILLVNEYCPKYTKIISMITLFQYRTMLENQWFICVAKGYYACNVLGGGASKSLPRRRRRRHVAVGQSGGRCIDRHRITELCIQQHFLCLPHTNGSGWIRVAL